MDMHHLRESEYNMQLSLNRSNSVKNTLIKMVQDSRLKTRALEKYSNILTFLLVKGRK